MTVIAFVPLPDQGPNAFGGVHYETQGYCATTVTTLDHATALNRRQGLTPEVVEAFHIGSMFGWHVPGAKLAHDFMRAKARADAVAEESA